MSRGIPPAYSGREQTWFKHSALGQYLIQWALKVGSVARRWRGPLKLWYFETHAGPWESRDEERHDTSVSLGLKALTQAQEHSRNRGIRFEVGAVFVERERARYDELRRMCEQFADRVDVRPLFGDFEDQIETVNRLIADSPAFVFVDPIGWKQADMESISRCAEGWRDILVRVPSEVPRFMSRREVRSSLLRFLGLPDDFPEGRISESELLRLYRRQIRARCGKRFAAEMAIPDPKRERTAAWLVVGGSHPKVLEVFRDVEQSVGAEALDVRTKIRDERRTPGQGSLFAPQAVARFDTSYEARLRKSVRELPDEVVRMLQVYGPISFQELWPRLLEHHHLRKHDLNEVILDLVPERVFIKGMGQRERRIKDDYMLHLASHS